MSEPIPITETVISTVSNQLPDMTDEQVQQVIQAWNAVRQGDPVGTVRRNPETRQVAHRVSVDGVHLWRVSAESGEQYNDMVPTMPWPVIVEPDATPDTEDGGEQ